MTLFERWSIERRLRQIHGWIGAFLLPWVVLAGLTGFYMNHQKLVLSVFPVGGLPEAAAYADQPDAKPVLSATDAIVIADQFRPGSSMTMDRDTSYRGRTVWTVDTGDDAVIIDRETGFVWVQERYKITAYAPDGAAVGTERRWSRIFLSLHSRGWIGEGLGRWLADSTAISLVVFGLSGIVLFWSPRLRKRRNKKARGQAAKAA